MANSRKTANKPATVAQFPPPPGAAAVEDVPQAFQEAAEPQEAKPEPAQPPPRSPLKKKMPSLPPNGDFFGRVAAVPQADWEAGRVYLYLYVLEPLCNLRQQGGKAYFNRYSEPVRDEHQIAVECGSGRYRLILAYNKVSAEDSNELARYEFEIYNPQYPPKVPKAAWINDARNAKWEALLPPPPAPQTPAGSIVDAMRMVSDIRRDLKEEMEPEVPPPSSTSEVLATMKAAKDLFGTNGAAAPAKDPLEIAVALFTTMNQMKAENPVIDLYREQLKMMQAQMERLQQQIQQPAAAPKSFIEQAMEFASMGEKLEPLKKLFGWSGGGGTEAPARRTTGMEIAREAISKIIDSPIAEGFGQWLGSLAQKNVNGTGPQQPIMNPGQNGAQPVARAPNLMQFVETVVNPALLSHYTRGLTGSDFAAWMADGYPQQLLQLQNFTHPMIPGQRGPGAIIAAYKHTPSMWPTLSLQGEEAFSNFVTEFCAWKPEEEDVQDAEVINTTAERPDREESENEI